MLEELIAYGLRGLECYYAQYPLDCCKWLAETAEKRGLLVSGGSDYHGSNKTVEPGILNSDMQVIQPERLTILDVVSSFRGPW